MASKQLKRRAEESKPEDNTTPGSKKIRLAASGSTGRRTRRTEQETATNATLCVSPFVVDQTPGMTSADPPRSPKPPSAEEFKAMLRDNLARRAAFNKVRRSFRVWPIKGNDSDELDANFRDFAIEALLIPDTVIRDIRFEEILQVRTSPQNNVYMEALVTFQDDHDRDFFFSKARNLAEYRDSEGRPTAGNRLAVPPFLLPIFKLLNEYGYEIRNVNGRDTKRYIKFDDQNLSLFLEVRLSGQSKWIKVCLDQARSYSKEKDRAEYSIIRTGLLSGMNTRSNSNPNLVPLGSDLQSCPLHIGIF